MPRAGPSRTENLPATASGRGWSGSAKVYLAAEGRSASDRNNIMEAHEELGRRGQELREMTRDLDQLKADVDSFAMVIRFRSGIAASGQRPVSAAGDDGGGDGAA